MGPQLIAIAPAPLPNDGPTTRPVPTDHAMSFTCVTCSRRKVKCDKVGPICSTCRRAHLDCEWQDPPPRKRKRVQGEENLQTLQLRLQQYETVLKKHNLLAEADDGSTSSLSPGEGTPLTSKRAPDPPPGNSWYLTGKGKLLTGDGKTRYIDSNIWRQLNDDDLGPSSDEEDEVEPPSMGLQPLTPSDPVSTALVGTGPKALLALHPTYDMAMKLWKVYAERVDPICKIVHVPSGVTTVQRGAAQPSSLSRANEALLFSIYHFAVLALTDAECHKLLGESQQALQARYYEGVRHALVHAHFLRTTEIATFQAYLLFLLSVRTTYDPNTFWILTGIAVRIAHRMGLHRDGEDLGLKPFDVQMRRRIFWQVLPLDGLSAQLAGTGVAISSDSWDVQQPLNLNDTDIWPDMTEPPTPHTGATDMIFCLARTEIGKFHKKTNPSLGHGNWAAVWATDGVANVESMMKEISEVFETKYIRYCDFADPLHNLVVALCRTALQAGRLRVRLSRAKHLDGMTSAERDDLRAVAMKILDYNLAALDSLILARFRWQIMVSFQWDPIIWILHEVRKDPASYIDIPIWARIDEVLRHHPEILIMRRSLHYAVAKLVLRAWEAWVLHMTTNLPAGAGPLVQEPEQISALRLRLAEREKSRSSNSTTPNVQYNPFHITDDGAEDFALPHWLSAETEQQVKNASDAFSGNGMGDGNGLMEINPQSGDWMFWDQLIHDPSVFSMS